ncbi:hypothetical protein PV325_006860 [Microctonus aethiopoides]|nr:hypothetical protein PV325_006860 [Microctonus aethiopoides]
MIGKHLICFTVCIAVTQAKGKLILDNLYLGFNVPSLSGRIVGGTEAVKGAFPHQVSLQWGLPPLIPSKHFCGGSIINEQWILTAGHCVLAVPNYGSFIVKAGKHAIDEIEITEQSIVVSASFIHKEYKGGVAPYDIALLKLKSLLVLSELVAPVKLPEAASIPMGNTILSGWGSISSSSSNIMPPKLQTAILPIISLALCKEAVENLTGPSPLHVTNMCTGPLTGGYSACSGDSGGPLILNDSNGSAELVGVVSWGIMPCGSKGAPSVYTRVSAYIEWIQMTISKN